jgi:hypothetical protein
MVTNYYKNCDCKSGSTTNQIRAKAVQLIPLSYTIKYTWHPGPSCDLCGKPWIRTQIKDRSEFGAGK